MKYVTARTAAKRLGVSRSTIGRWVREGKFRGVKAKGKGATSPYLIPADSVLAMASDLGSESGDVIVDSLD